MTEKINNDEELKTMKCDISILHSRFAEVRRFYQNDTDGAFGIPEEHAHPNFDHEERIALFHNG